MKTLTTVSMNNHKLELLSNRSNQMVLFDGKEVSKQKKKLFTSTVTHSFKVDEDREEVEYEWEMLFFRLSKRLTLRKNGKIVYQSRI